ncbi:MAG TPA: HtaA domain-containing protein, partial [Conexibacter sp.]|nr:HtaA domain-containing protein [Conexibacter sp.]
MQLPATRPSLARAGALGALVVTVVLALLASRAQAAVTPISSGALDWGVKQSFRNYIVSPIAHGSIATAGGATANPDGTFHFPLAGGAYDDDTGTTIVAFGGSVRFAGHDGQLDMTLSDVRVELAPDGARLLADISSLPFPVGGPPASYPDTELLRLDLTGVDPAVGGGTTSWAAIPGALSGSGAPAFAGFYGPGTAFDAVSFDYAGPGGKPVAESWSAPGAPAFGPDGEATGIGGFNRLFVDEANHALHVVAGDSVEAFDLDTLAPLARATPGTLDQFAIAFDPETATVFVDAGTGTVLSYRYDADAGAYVPGSVDLAPARTLDYDPATDQLWAIGTPPPSPFFAGNPTVEVATRASAAWDVERYPELETDGRNIRSVVRSSSGRLVATYGPILIDFGPPLQLDVHGSATLADSGSALVATDVPDTVASAPAAGTTQGYLNAAAAPDGGRVLATELGVGMSELRTLTLVPSAANPSGYAAQGSPLVASADLFWFAFDRAAAWDYGVFGDRVDVYDAGEVVASIPTGGTSVVEGGFRALYAGDSGDGTLTRWAHLGAAPTIDAQPADVTVQLSSSDATRAVQFSAAASGTPAPSVRWQQRPPGATGWTDVPGATATTLQVEAAAALAGTRYRAVFESAAGRLATAAATLAVSVVPPRAAEPPRVDPPPAPPVAPPLVRRPTPQPPLLDASRRRASVGRGGTATLATFRCRASAACRVSAPRRVRLTIHGVTYRVGI